MAEKSSFERVVRDLFPFGKDYDEADQSSTHAASAGDAVKSNASNSKDSNPKKGEDVTSQESFEKYKKREILINTKTDFLYTLRQYMSMITTGLGSLAFGAMALKMPVLGTALGSLLPAGAAALIQAAPWAPVIGFALAVRLRLGW